MSGGCVSGFFESAGGGEMVCVVASRVELGVTPSPESVRVEGVRDIEMIGGDELPLRGRFGIGLAGGDVVE